MELAGEKYYQRGVAYFKDGCVLEVTPDSPGIFARVQGTGSCPYAVRLWVANGELDWGCTCPIGQQGQFCKHTVATALAWLEAGPTHDAPSGNIDIRDVLDTADPAILAECLKRRVVWDDDLSAEVALAVRAAASIRKS